MSELASSPKDDKKKGYDDWECKDFAETLMRAEEIKMDPKKMAAASKHIKKMQKQISSIDDIRKAANDRAMEDDEEGEES